MNPIIHSAGIAIKYILLNGNALWQWMKSPKILDIEHISKVVFTHDLGGGTEMYVNSHFRTASTLIVRLVSYRNNAFFCLENQTAKVVVTKKQTFNILKCKKFSEVVVNSLCAYSNINEILSFVANEIHVEKISYLIHDFHCVCPTGSFIYRNKYCGLDCINCKKRKLIVKKWFPIWDSFFDVASSIICFSNSSKEILLKFYPRHKGKMLVIPHSMDYCKFKPLGKLTGKNIGIVGNCSIVAKGKNVIAKLKRHLEKTRKYKLVVIGKSPFWVNRKSPFYESTGTYKQEFLPETIIECQIGVILFTSILPETFSYVISELMMLDVPIVSLDLGAQGEKLSGYKNGYFIDNLEPKTIVDFVDEFWKTKK